MLKVVTAVVLAVGLLGAAPFDFAQGDNGAAQGDNGGANQGDEAGSLVASDRCNDQILGDLESQVREADAHPPRDQMGPLEQRYGQLAMILEQLSEERGIIENVCSTDAQKLPYYARIAAAAAWTLALQADIAGKLNGSCPPMATALPAAILAQAWLDLASLVNIDENGTVPPVVAQTEPRIQSRAQAVGLTLPTLPNTSDYWRRGIADKARATLAACPSPSASPFTSPTAAPSA